LKNKKGGKEMRKQITSIMVVSLMVTIGIVTFIPETEKAQYQPPVFIRERFVCIGQMWIEGGGPYENEVYVEAYDVDLSDCHSGDEISFFFQYKIIGDHEILLEIWQFDAICTIDGIDFTRHIFFDEQEDYPWEPNYDNSTTNWQTAYVDGSWEYEGPVSGSCTLTVSYRERDWLGDWVLPPTTASDTSSITLELS
jgi:hypothetical protein